MEANETPQALKNNFFSAHVGHRVDQANTVESKLDEMTLVSHWVQVVASQGLSVLGLLDIGVQEKWVCSLDVVVD